MIKTEYKIEEETLFTVTICLTNYEVCKIISMMSFTGFNLKDAIRNANKRLNIFGYYVE